MLQSSFEKIYCVDTNIILDDVINLEILSQKSSNLIVIPETVMDELDVKKSGFSEINYQARSFGRLLEKADILSVRQENGYVVSRMFINGEKCITVDVISLLSYPNLDKMDSHIINDRKILEVAIKAKDIYEEDVVFISNDVMCRLRAISLGLVTEALGKDNESEVQLYAELPYEDTLPSSIELQELNVKDTIFGLCLYSPDGNKKYYYRSGITFFEISEDELKKQNIKPQNIEQKIYSSLILDPFYNVVISDSPAGTGKTLVALSSAMKLMDEKYSVYNKIIYIRKTIVSTDTDLGFLPGTLSEKMAGYLAPLYGSLEAIVREKYGKNKKKMSDEEIKAKVDDMIKDYNIDTVWQGHLRGQTLAPGSIIIYDEISNDSVSDLRTTLTRIGKDSKVICVGCNTQIDSKYVNRYNNALTFLKNKLGKDNMNVNIGGINLVKTVRSNIAEWADDFK